MCNVWKLSGEMKGNVSFFPSMESLCHVYNPCREILVPPPPANVRVAFSRFLVLFFSFLFSFFLLLSLEGNYTWCQLYIFTFLAEAVGWELMGAE